MVIMTFNQLASVILSLSTACLMKMGHGHCYNVVLMAIWTSTVHGRNTEMVLGCLVHPPISGEYSDVTDL